MEFMSEVRAWTREAMHRLKLTQTELAREIGWKHQSNVSNFLRGQMLGEEQMNRLIGFLRDKKIISRELSRSAMKHIRELDKKQ
jgi:hypothetical protein